MKRLLLLNVIVIILVVVLASKDKDNYKRNLRAGNGAFDDDYDDDIGNEFNNSPFKQRKAKFIITEIPNVGKVKGLKRCITSWTGKELYQFYDIKYGQSPKGKRRFKNPEKAKPWKNVRQAIVPRHGCPSLQDMSLIKRSEFKHDVEDCLTLSVHTKNLTDKVPVMVYLHGEFLYEGTPHEANPEYLLEKDVILVTIRYRLGPFGFLSTQSERIPGNAAVYDVILALEWIQKHIYVFGGDPNSVTLFGQVGGAAIANILTMSPVVREGLFHRVIYQSGTALTPAFVTDSPLQYTENIAKHAGCKKIKVLKALNRCLAKMNVTTLLQAFSDHGAQNADKGISYYGGVQFVVGGPSNILPDHPGKLIKEKKIRYYPTMGGVVKNAGTFLLKEIFEDSFNETIPDKKFDANRYIDFMIAQTNGADANNAWTKFAKAEFFSNEQLKNGTFAAMLPGLIDMCGTIPFKNPVLLSLQANAEKLPNSTYLYSFNYEGEFNRYLGNDEDSVYLPFEFGVSLTDDNLYLFPWPKYAKFLNYRDKRIAKQMVDLWSSFAITGIPKSDKISSWPPLTDGSGPYLKIDRISKVEKDFLNEFSVTTKDAQKGYSLLSNEYFENIEELNALDEAIKQKKEMIKKRKQQHKPQPHFEQQHNEEEDDEEDDDDEEYYDEIKTDLKYGVEDEVRKIPIDAVIAHSK